MPVSCSSVGDIIALVQLGIKIVDVLNESRKAPADCRALCNDLRSLERLIALSQPAIDGLQDHTLRELVNEHLESVSRHILDGLRLVCNFDTAFDTSTDHARRHLRQSLRHWATKSKQSIIWALRHNPSARDARATIAQGFTSLIFALLVCVLKASTCFTTLNIQLERSKRINARSLRRYTMHTSIQPPILRSWHKTSDVLKIVSWPTFQTSISSSINCLLHLVLSARKWPHLENG